METKLSTQEYSEAMKRFNSFNLDISSRKLAIRYFLEYKNKTEQMSSLNLLAIINCAILAASKSQVISTIDGESVRGVGISVTQLARDLNNSNNKIRIEDFLLVLKSFINTVELTEDVISELKSTIEKFAFAHTFYIKFEKLLKELGLENNISEEMKEYVQNLKGFGWLVYISSKDAILQNRTEFVESIFLLTVVIGHMLYYAPDEITDHFFQAHIQDSNDETNSKKDMKTIHSVLFKLLKFKSVELETLTYYQESFCEFLNMLIKTKILKNQDNTGYKDLYSHNTLMSNLNKLDLHYQKNLSYEGFDERFYVNEIKINTPGKFTPFARQGVANKLNLTSTIHDSHSVHKKGASASYRTLNYEINNKISVKLNLNEIKFATKSIPQSPYTRLLPATPMTKAIEMYSWLNDKVQNNKVELSQNILNLLKNVDSTVKDSILPRAKNIIGRILSYEKKLTKDGDDNLIDKKLKDKYKQVLNLYLRVIEDLLIQEGKRVTEFKVMELLKDESYHKSMLAACVETVLFINNTTNIKFENLLKLSEIQAFEFWCIINIFATFDPQLPQPLKKHFYDIELKIILHLAWKKDSMIHQLIKISIEKGALSNNSSFKAENTNLLSNKNSQENVDILKKNCVPSFNKQQDSEHKLCNSHFYEMYFKRVLHITALQVQQLCELLRLSEDTAEKVWMVIKYILSSETILLIDRHIDQLILCSIYGVCKASNRTLKFQDLITKYQELPNFNKNDLSDVLHQVLLNNSEKVDLIQFYNLVFLNQLKTIIFSALPNYSLTEIASATPLIKKPIVSALVMESPLRESLPSIMSYGNLSLHRKSEGSMLEFSQPLPAKPMISSQGGNTNVSDSITSKRQIDFDDNFDNEEDLPPVKKLKHSNSIVEKIMEYKSQEIEENENSSSLRQDEFKRSIFEGSITQFSPSEKSLNNENSNSIFSNGLYPLKALRVPFSPVHQIQSQKALFLGKEMKFGFENTNSNILLERINSQTLSEVAVDEEVMSMTSGKKSGIITPEFGK